MGGSCNTGGVRAKEGIAREEVVSERSSCGASRLAELMEMFDEFINLRGQSYNYKIAYSHISRLFLLPRPGQTAISFVISVDPPIRQGKTAYNHLITTFPAHDESSITLNLSDEAIADTYGGKLEKELSGPTYEVLTKVFKVLSKKRMSIPKGFRTARGDSCVKCAVGNQEGHLYVLEKSFMFVNKPAMHLRFDDLEHVDPTMFQKYKQKHFQRVGTILLIILDVYVNVNVVNVY